MLTRMNTGKDIKEAKSFKPEKLFVHDPKELSESKQ